ncbi:methyltransferase domain-containing protein [Clostridium paraputrificum]|uniref:methyltransferase domain-containing protein n=1 Tax=Clostridium paraputrificum TaxID=29363 RepID=UPI003D33E81C
MEKEMIKEYIMERINTGLIQEAYDLILQYKKTFGNEDDVASMEAIINIYDQSYDEAMRCVKEGLKLNIFNSDLYYTMGNIYELKNEYNRAYLCYEQSLRYASNDENREVIFSAISNLKLKYNIDVNNYSIVLLTYNNLEYTKICIDSIKRYSCNEDYEIIVVDNNSTDGTVEWLKKQEGIKYILNKENKGFPAGCNQGIELSKKDNDIFLLNNDTVIMPNSILNLRIGLYSDEEVGATGAVSNSVAYYQQISEVYDDFDGYMDFALKNNIADENSYESRVKLIGFAMLIKRNVLDKVGLLDERFTPGNFEDDDISLRILMEGYKLLLCRDSYIHHFGSVSFKKDKKGFNEVLKINSKKFEEKWGFVSEYSTGIRYDLINLINESIDKKMNVLEVGCACGSTLLAIKNIYPNSKIYGIEINKNSARIANCFADVRDENIENSDLTYEEDYFDYIILGDVLEHLYNPTKVLSNMKKYLKDDGYILASIPNVMHHSVMRSLINGYWTYEDAGILDRTHMRFFTKNEIINMFSEAGYKNIEIGNINTYKSEDDEVFIDKLNQLSSTNMKEEFGVYQYLIRSKNHKDSDEEVEKECTSLIKRIESGVDVEETEKELMEKISSGKFKINNIINAVEKDIANKVYVLNYLAIKCFENKINESIIPLLNSAYELDNQDLDTNYNLAYILNLAGEGKLAIKYLNNLESTSEDIEILKNIIMEKVDE